MKSAKIRQSFLEFFEKHGHRREKSSSLIPAEDPTLLFTNAGMVPFKDYFLGLRKPKSLRMTTSQKCLRAGGKHNDLENVGFTARHHTFFEMLGNFSFGDYFKEDAISFAWELLTQVWKLPKEKLRITVFETDDEAFELWKKQGVRPDFIHRLGEKDNFWAMGETGPCGPCSEIHFDFGEKYGGPKKETQPGGSSDRFLEIWNLVFMQFNRDSSGKLTPLPKPSVDTGSGLERVSAVLQGVFSNYDTDLFQPILNKVASLAKTSYGKNKETDVSLRVIADHLRATTFLMSDGVIPSNEGRGYVLRRILRRAIRHGKKLGQDKPFIANIVPTLVTSLGEFYPEIKKNQKLVQELITEEEVRFHETLHKGMRLLEEAISQTQNQGQSKLSGEIAFKLYDTYGFPLDLTAVICQEQNLKIDEPAFEKKMEEQRGLSQFQGQKDSGKLENIQRAFKGKTPTTKFLGYQALSAPATLTHAFDSKGIAVKSLSGEGFVLFDKTPFYAESGGQMGDTGIVSSRNASAEILNTIKLGNSFLHQVKTKKGKLTPQQKYDLAVNTTQRKLTAINHTATHLLHAALREVLGERVKQAGSLVSSTHLRFDFTFPRALTSEEKEKIEDSINEEVQKGEVVTKTEMPYTKAIQSGAMAFFDEKYGDKVRVIRVGSQEKPYSIELCGGTHLDNTSEIGFFKIRSEGSIASGTRRIEAVTSTSAIKFLEARSRQAEEVEKATHLGLPNLVQRFSAMEKEIQALREKNEKLQWDLAQGGGKTQSSLWDKKKTLGKYQVVMEIVPNLDAKILRTLVDQTRDKLEHNAIVLLASPADGKLNLCLGISKDLVGKLDAGKLIAPVAELVGGRGGGRADFAQAGGTNPDKIPQAFKALEEELTKV